jgi:hypothetical protein
LSILTSHDSFVNFYHSCEILGYSHGQIQQETSSFSVIQQNLDVQYGTSSYKNMRMEATSQRTAMVGEG